MVRYAGCLCGNKCSWTLKSGGTHQTASTVVNHDSLRTSWMHKKPLWGMIPGLCKLLSCIQTLLGRSQVGRGQILDREQSKDLLSHGTTFLCPGLSWKLQRQPWYAKRCRTGTSMVGKGLLASRSYGVVKEVTSRDGCSTHTD